MENNSVKVRRKEVVHCDWPGEFCPVTGENLWDEWFNVWEVLGVTGNPFILYPKGFIFVNGVLARLSDESITELEEHNKLPNSARIDVYNQTTLTDAQVLYLSESGCEVIEEKPAQPSALL